MGHYVFSLPEILRDAFSDRDFGHRVVTKALPDDLPSPPRASSDCLWSLDAAEGLLHVRANVPIRTDIFGELVSSHPVLAPPMGRRLTLRGSVACQFSPSPDIAAELRPMLKARGRAYRSRLVPVPAERRAAWLSGKLTAAGFTVDALEISELQLADLGKRGGGVPFISFTATGQVADEQAFAAAMRHGVGRGKNFGLGLIHAELLTAPKED